MVIVGSVFYYDCVDVKSLLYKKVLQRTLLKNLIIFLFVSGSNKRLGVYFKIVKKMSSFARIILKTVNTFKIKNFFLCKASQVKSYKNRSEVN